MSTVSCDVLIVGGGNAGFSAAVAAAQSNAGKVILIDKCPKEWAGGNSHFTAGAFRTVHAGLDDLLPLVTNVDAETAKIVDLEPYTKDDFVGDMERITHGRYDLALGEALVGESNETVKWLAKNGLAFQLSFNRQVNLCYSMEIGLKQLKQTGL
jgi:succinate dehydrogenase/fumarate reductase flavoprotein subunit